MFSTYATLVLCLALTAGMTSRASANIVVYSQGPETAGNLRLGFTSDTTTLPLPNARAMTFSLASNAELVQMSWWGFYNNTPNVPPSDSFAISFNPTSGGIPVSAPISIAGLSPVTRTADPNNSNVYQYTASINPLALTGGTTYALSIVNTTNSAERWRWLNGTGTGSHFFSDNNGLSWSLSGFNENLSVELTANPEPSSLALTGLIAAGVGYRVWRKRRRDLAGVASENPSDHVG